MATGNAGPLVSIRLYPTADDELQSVALSIGAHIESGVPPSSIGVLLDDVAARKTLHKLLAILDCGSEDYSKPGGAKFIDIFDPSVKVLTTGSAKGIEFQVLFVPAITSSQFPTSDADGETSDRARRRLYTAITRCAYELHLSAPQESASGLLDELNASFVQRHDLPHNSVNGTDE